MKVEVLELAPVFENLEPNMLFHKLTREIKLEAPLHDARFLTFSDGGPFRPLNLAVCEVMIQNTALDRREGGGHRNEGVHNSRYIAR